MKRHRNDSCRIAVLRRESREIRGNTNKNVSYVKHEEFAEFMLMDALTGESKHSSLSSAFFAYEDGKLTEICEGRIETKSTYDGNKAWAANGITKAEIERHEAFHRAPLENADETTLRRLREDFLRVATNKRNEIPVQNEENTSIF